MYKLVLHVYCLAACVYAWLQTFHSGYYEIVNGVAMLAIKPVIHGVHQTEKQTLWPVMWNEWGIYVWPDAETV